MPGSNRQPTIAGLSWGRIELGDGRVFRDVKLSPAGACEWDWTESGTRHVPGVQVADVADLVDAGAETVVIGTGFYERLGVQQETRDWLAARGVTLRVAETGHAAADYNARCAAGKVAALIHSTC
jgi:hypothetical protein